MLIRTIELRNEKEAPYRKLKLSGGFNIISGMNGEGKTYLLETIASGLQVLADNFALSGELFIKKDAKTDSAEILNSTDGSDRPTVGRIIRCVMEIDGSGKCFQLKRIVNESGEEDTVIEDPGLADIIGRASGKDLPIFSFYRSSGFMEFDWDSTEHSSMITKEKRNSAYQNWSDAGNNDSCERTLSWIRETASLRNELELREGDSSRNIHQSDERRVLNRMLNAAFP
ncbi:hypothetical protein [uncultured Sutterella sp.]|uniref:hypothetical protein n=1 Tax=uncultured Sutterella sp. TaxID=286133 RepID=UPI002608747B|nr:hypothetical protein [uncultured Sutterella sp.]